MTDISIDRAPAAADHAATPTVSVVVIAYDMARELPRTIASLCPPYQTGIDAGAVEIILVDNGSPEPVRRDALPPTEAALTLVTIANASPSPSAAINIGLRQARGALVGLWVDGARIASPGVLAGAAAAHCMDPEAPVITLGFHLGEKPQQEAMREGYDQAAEDRLLEQADWQADGYRLFDICAVAKSSAGGWFGKLVESNGLFLPRSLWERLGGVDERFALPGGGLVNLDLFSRMLAETRSTPVTLLGEGTFHQVHGGVSTNAPESPWAEFAADYAAITGQAYDRPDYASRYLAVLDGPRLDAVLRKTGYPAD